MAKAKKKKTKEKKTIKDNIFILLPLMIAGGLVPIIVLIKDFVITDELKSYFGDVTYGFDMFTWYKSRLIIICGMLALGIILYKILFKKENIGISKYTVPVGIYGFFVIISTLCSEYVAISWQGYPTRYEGAWVILSYIFLFIFAIMVVKQYRNVNRILKVIGLCSGVVATIGILQYFNIYFSQTEVGVFIERLFLDKNFQGDIVQNMRPGMVYSTLFNPNYVSSYFSMIIPILILLVFKTKNILLKILWVLLALAGLLCLYGSSSSSIYLAVLGSMFFFVVIFSKKAIKHWKIALPIVLVIVISGSVLMVKNVEYFRAEINTVKQLFNNDKADTYLEGLEIEDNTVKFVTQNGTIVISNIGGSMYFTDEENEALEVVFENSIVSFKDERFNIFKVLLGANEAKTESFIAFTKYTRKTLYDIVLNVQENGFGDPVGRLNISFPYEEAKRIGFIGNENFGSSRGYIWSCTMGIIVQHPIFGQGSDTQTFCYPQNDVVGKFNTPMRQDLIIDKPHSYYLQIAQGAGIPALLAVIFLLGYFFFSTAKILITKGIKSDAQYTLAAISCGIAGWSVTMLVNDSSVCVTPLFWVLIGLGVVCIRIIKKEVIEEVGVNK